MRAEIEKIAVAWASYIHFAFPSMSCKFSVTKATLQSPIKKYFLVFIDFQQMIDDNVHILNMLHILP